MAVVQDLRQQIAAGKLRPGDRVLSERQLAQRYRQSLHVVRLALRNLRDDGVVEARPRSGLYVTSAAAPPGEANLQSQDYDASIGFHLYDRQPARETTVRFVIGGWNPRNKAVWQRICADFSRLEPLAKIEPIYPANWSQYRQLIRNCECFITTPENLPMFLSNEQLVGFPMDTLEDAGIHDRYIQQAIISPGVAGGVPISATLALGMINRRLVGDALTRSLMQAADWPTVFSLLADWSREHPHVPSFNLNYSRPLNLHELLRLAGADTLPTEQCALDLDAPRIREVLTAAVNYYQHTPHWSGRASDAAVSVSFTCNYDSEFNSNSNFEPWVPPCGPNGYYLEGLNIGVMHPDAPQPDIVRAFLLYLASPGVQKQFAPLLREHTVSRSIVDPFAAYNPAVRAVLRRVHAGAMNVLGHAGLCSYAHTARISFSHHRFFEPLSEHLLSGELDIDTFCNRIKASYAEDSISSHAFQSFDRNHL